MLIFEKVVALQQYIAAAKKKGKSIGFVPTMGALHEGHLSLLKCCQAETDISVCSIFVNPTQFDEKDDFDKYPRTTATDTKILDEHDCTILFLPNVSEIYPSDYRQKVFDFGYLAQPMEGAFRTGHFEGVGQVVNRLLEIVLPHKIFMGQKDYQQYCIITELVRITNRATTVVRCPIVRESDGLAMSSRNVRLSSEERQKAPIIAATLNQMAVNYKVYTVGELQKWAIDQINSIEGMSVDYLEIVNAHTLQAIHSWDDAPSVIVCTTVKLGSIRLLDNKFLFEAGTVIA